MSGKLRHVRISLEHANGWVELFHRHHKPVVGHVFSLGAMKIDCIVGVVIVGRPVSRMRDDGDTARIIARSRRNAEASAAPQQGGDA